MSRISEFFVGFRHWKEDFRPYGIPKAHFLKSEWEEFLEPHRTSWTYLTWRGLYVLFCIFAVSYSLTTSTHPHLWLIYLTRWSLSCQLIYSVLFFSSNLAFLLSRQNRKYSTYSVNAREMKQVQESFRLMRVTVDTGKRGLELNSVLESIIWVMVGIVGIIPIFVTVGYWTIVYPDERDELSTVLFVGTVLVHGVNAVFALIDNLLIAIPIRVTQFIYLFLFSGTYAAFSGFYELAGGSYPTEPDSPYVYSVLNWREKPREAAIASVITVLVSVLMYYLLWLIYVFRLFLVSSVSRRKDRDSVHSFHQYWLRSKIDSIP